MSYTTNSCYDSCLVYPAYTCIHTPYNDPTFYEALASSGSLSLGTSAGTDRSISGEFGGSTPHGLSEYYGVASGVPSSGTIDFSDFHGKAAVNPVVTSCLWTHYDFSGCSVGNLQAACTTSAAASQQCLDQGYLTTNSQTWNHAVNGQICTLTSNGVSNNYWLSCNWLSFRTCAGNAFWGTGAGASSYVGVDNTVFLVWQSTGGAAGAPGGSLGGYHVPRWNSGYNGYAWNSENYYFPFYSGHAWQFLYLKYYNKIYRLYIYGSDSFANGGFAYWDSDTGTIDNVNDSYIFGHRVSSGCIINASDSNYQTNYINASQAQSSPNTGTFTNTTNKYYSRVNAHSAGGFDFFNGGHSGYAITNASSRAAQCFAIGEYLHYKCKLTDAEWNSTFNYLKNKWSVTGGSGTC